jgi:hypothetical protein
MGLATFLFNRMRSASGSDEDRVSQNREQKYTTKLQFNRKTNHYENIKIKRNR